MSKIISVSLVGSDAVHGQALGADGTTTLCRPALGKRPYVPTMQVEPVTCRSCAKIIRESAQSVSAPAETDESRSLRALRAARVYVDNAGRIYGAQINAQTFRSLLSRGLIRINGASRTRLPNGRAARRVVLTIAGRSALGV